ncbi:MAG: hypothetical protein DMF90_24670 [Acidobacteria bacterium]|nr:MAG: hypothetical protein DMF90_24670 [Acidobacteriota bacterium]
MLRARSRMPSKPSDAGLVSCCGSMPTPETVISYETGWRSTLLKGRLRTQMGVFHSDYTNFQITNRNLRTGQGGALVNADVATLYGFEAQAQLVAGGFQADVSLAAMKSRIDNAVLVDERPGLVPDRAGAGTTRRSTSQAMRCRLRRSGRSRPVSSTVSVCAKGC